MYNPTPELEQLLKNFRDEFYKKMEAARKTGKTDELLDITLARICLQAAASEFRPLSPAAKKVAKELAAYI